MLPMNPWRTERCASLIGTNVATASGYVERLLGLVVYGLRCLRAHLSEII